MSKSYYILILEVSVFKYFVDIATAICAQYYDYDFIVHLSF